MTRADVPDVMLGTDSVHVGYERNSHGHRLLLLSPTHSRARKAPHACSRTQDSEAVPSCPHGGAAGPPWPLPSICRSGPRREPWRARRQKGGMRDLDSVPSRGVPGAGPRGSPWRKSEGLRDLVLPLPEWLESPRLVSAAPPGGHCCTHSLIVLKDTASLSFAKDAECPASLLAPCVRATLLTHTRFLCLFGFFFSVSYLDWCVPGSDLKARPTKIRSV